MRGYDGTFEFRPSLVGTLSYNLTACGNPVKVTGFADVMAVLIAGAVQGSANNQGTLNVKIQESASSTGTGALWSDITDGAINGTFAFTEIAIAAGTNQVIYAQKKYERMNDANRKAWIRAHATVAGTDSISIKYSVGFLLGRPIDSVYITDATSYSTLNTQYGVGL